MPKPIHDAAYLQSAIAETAKTLGACFNKFNDPATTTTNIDKVRFAEAIQHLYSLAGQPSTHYYDLVATERPFIVQECSTEVSPGVTKTVGYRAAMQITDSKGNHSFEIVVACKKEGLAQLKEVVDRANVLVIQGQVNPSAHLLEASAAVHLLEGKGLTLPISEVSSPSIQAETLPVRWVEYRNPELAAEPEQSM